MNEHKALASALLKEAAEILRRYSTDDRATQWERARLMIDAARVHASLMEKR